MCGKSLTFRPALPHAPGLCPRRGLPPFNAIYIDVSLEIRNLDVHASLTGAGAQPQGGKQGGGKSETFRTSGGRAAGQIKKLPRLAPYY